MNGNDLLEHIEKCRYCQIVEQQNISEELRLKKQTLCYAESQIKEVD